MNPKKASTDHPIHELLAARWSPYAFEDRSVAEADLRSLFEAARWAPSSYNEQPWSYIVARKEDPEEFGKLVSCLVEGNLSETIKKIGRRFTTLALPRRTWFLKRLREVLPFIR
jgi:nitroreductase